MAFLRRTRIRDGGFRRIVFYFLVTLFVISVLVILSKRSMKLGTLYSEESYGDTDLGGHVQWWDSNLMLPNQTELSITLDKQNHLPPRNLDLFPTLSEDHVKIVLYVYNRPHYLQVVVDSLAKVEGIEETLLIVSHDGFFPEMDAIVKRIRFCQVKQIYAPFSPHLFPNSFPGVSPGDCEGRDEGVASKKTCIGDSDQYMNYRSPNTVSLKHHWWWLMNTVWDGLEETKGYSGHVLFIEEDHFIYPNAYRSIQLLTKLKSSKCSYCYAANLSPSDVLSKGEGVDSLIAEKIGNIGYTFNRTVWNLIHSKTRDFCRFDEYNWDITMWSTVYPSFKTPVYTLRGSRTSAAHFGKCGLHQGQGKSNACVDNGVANFEVEEIDKVVNIKSDFGVLVLSNQGGYQKGFKGWGGWGDKRDHDLCMSFAKMYHAPQPS